MVAVVDLVLEVVHAVLDLGAREDFRERARHEIEVTVAIEVCEREPVGCRHVDAGVRLDLLELERGTCFQR